MEHVTDIRIIVKNGELAIFDKAVGTSVDICYISPTGPAFLQSPENLPRAIGRATLLKDSVIHMTTPTSGPEGLEIEVISSVSGESKPVSTKIKCSTAILLKSDSAISFGMDFAEAVGILHLTAMQKLISNGMNAFLQALAAQQQNMMMQSQIMGGGPGGSFPGGAADLRNLPKKPKH